MKKILKKFILKSSFVPTARALILDLKKFIARLQTKSMVKNYLKNNNKFPTKLHFGCGKRKVEDWLNIDLMNSDINIDFSKKTLPFPAKHFDIILSQHVIEHLEIKNELEPIFREFNRILKDDAIMYLSCPCIKKIVKSYLEDEAKTLFLGRKKRFPEYSLNGYPYVQALNEIFYQYGYHKNLFDLNLLTFCLKKTGFSKIEEISEEEFISIFPKFNRNDGEQSLYVRVKK